MEILKIQGSIKMKAAGKKKSSIKYCISKAQTTSFETTLLSKPHSPSEVVLYKGF